MPDPTRFVLIHPSHAGNVGAVARAMKVMGFAELVLVGPRDAKVCVQEEAVAMASGAADLLVRARVVSTLAEALEGVTWAVATAMTPRDFGPPTHAPREHLATLARSGERVGFVFGPERTGLANEDVYRCHACVSIPANPGYASLNLAQAVQVIAYEWRQALGGFAGAGPEPVPVPARTPDAAGAGEVQGALEHWRGVLERIGFLDPASPKKLMPRLNQLLNRARPTPEELHILRGIARAIDGHAASAAQARTPAGRQKQG
jgi:tRNA/rRNA methyltransferase